MHDNRTKKEGAENNSLILQERKCRWHQEKTGKALERNDFKADSHEINDARA